MSGISSGEGMNSKDYWEGRFAGDWTQAGGPAQSRFFTQVFFRMAPPWLVLALRSGASVLDWGCAEGDGTFELASGLPGATVSGVDFSANAVETASARYPTLDFHCADVLEDGLGGSWDFIFSSNTLEHFKDPLGVLRRLAAASTRGMILLVPFAEFPRIDEHEVTFDGRNIPLRLSGFSLVHACVIDSGAIPGTMWAGQQALLVFVKDGDALLESLVLEDGIRVASPAAAIVPGAAGDAGFSTELARSISDALARSVRAELRVTELEAELFYAKGLEERRRTERDTVSAEAREIQAALDAARSELARLQQDRSAEGLASGQQVMELEAAVQARERELGILRQQASDLDAVRVELARLQRERTSEGLVLGQQVMELEAAVDARNRELELLRQRAADLDAVRTELARLQRERSSEGLVLGQQVMQLEAAVNARDRELELLRQRSAELSRLGEEGRAALIAHEMTISQLGMDVASSNMRVSVADAELSALRAALLEQHEKGRALDLANQALASDCGKLKARLDAAKAEIASLLGEHAAQGAELAKAHAERDAAIAMEASLRETLASAQARFSSDADRLKAGLDAAHAQIAALKEGHAAQGVEVARALAERDAALSIEASLRAELESAKALAGARDLELSALISECDAIKAREALLSGRLDAVLQGSERVVRPLAPVHHQGDAGGAASPALEVRLPASEITTLLGLVRRLGADASALDAFAREVVGSSSWRLGRPLRKLVAGLSLRSGAEAPLPTSSAAVVLPELERVLLGWLASANAMSDRRFRLGSSVLYIMTGVPYDDIGGGQRAAQLARVALARGLKVVYVYAYRKWEGGVEVESRVELPNLEHRYLDDSVLADISASLRPEDTVLFELPHPRFLPVLRAAAATGASSVFEMIDAWDSSLGGDWFSEGVLEEYLRASRKVVGTAKVLQNMLKGRGRDDALYLPNAFNEAIFDCYRTFPRPHEYVDGKRVFLYFGSLYGEWFCWDSVYAAARKNQDAVIYLIGDGAARPDAPSNLVFLGARVIDELPAYLAHADVALLPFKPGHISDAVSPIKVFEYLAMGVPVVSLYLPEVVGYPNVHVANSVEEFAELCSRPLPVALDEDFLMSNSWGARLDALLPAPPMHGLISVVVLMHNNEKIIGRCLRSLRRHAVPLGIEIIVVDNQSSDRGAEIVRTEFPEVKLVSNSKNGCSSGRNLGVSQASGEYIMFLDSDQWFTSRGAFEESFEVLKSNPAVGAVGWAAGWFADGNESFGGPIVDYLPKRGTTTADYVAMGFRTDIAYLGSGGMLVSRTLFDAVRGFDEAYDPTCFEDTDFSLLIKNAGRLIAYRDLQGIRHQAHQTTGASASNERYQEIFRRNAEHFGKKWAHRPHFFFDRPAGG